MQQTQSVDVTNSAKESGSEISSINTYIQLKKALNESIRKAGNPTQRAVGQISEQLDKIRKNQKRYLRKPKTSVDTLLELIGLARGKGTQSYQELRKILIQVVAKCEPEVKNIISEEAIKAIGCTQEQSFSGISLNLLDVTPTIQLPFSATTTIPVQSLDLISLASGMLKLELDNPIAKILYEMNNPSVIQGVYRPYGGKEPFPMNRTLNLLTQTPNASYKQNTGKVYQGSSGQPLMDIVYTKVNEYGITGDYYKIALINRSGNTVSNNTTLDNKIHLWLKDYYSTIKFFDTSKVGAQIVQLVQSFMSMKLQMGSGEITNQSKFYNIARRISGLCFDSRNEIDVSGVAKVAELDGIDESFFEQTEVDLRNIEESISNIQQGVNTYIDCNNVKLPTDFESLTNQFVDFNSNISGQTIEEQVNNLNSIIDSISQNPEWRLFTNSNFLAGGEIDRNIFQQIGLAVASAALSPKVLLPIFVMQNYVQSEAVNSYTGMTSGNPFTVTGITNISGQINNIVNDGVGFLRQFKTFSVQVISKITAIFIRELFSILKKDILRLLKIVLVDIQKSQLDLERKRRLRLLTIISSILTIGARGVFDALKCKSLLDEIKDLLNLVNTVADTTLDQPANPPPKARPKLNALLAIATDFLPGQSPERSTINTINYMQQFGLPTIALPDGTPNLMLFYNYAIHKGNLDEMYTNGVCDTILIPGKTGNPPRWVTVPR